MLRCCVYSMAVGYCDYYVEEVLHKPEDLRKTIRLSTMGELLVGHPVNDSEQIMGSLELSVKV